MKAIISAVCIISMFLSIHSVAYADKTLDYVNDILMSKTPDDIKLTPSISKGRKYVEVRGYARTIDILINVYADIINTGRFREFWLKNMHTDSADGYIFFYFSGIDRLDSANIRPSGDHYKTPEMLIQPIIDNEFKRGLIETRITSGGRFVGIDGAARGRKNTSLFFNRMLKLPIFSEITIKKEKENEYGRVDFSWSAICIH